MVLDPTASEKKYRCKDVNSLGRLLSEIKVEDEVDFGIGREEVEGCQGKLEQKKNKNGGGKEERKEKLASPLKHVPTKVERPNHPSKTEMRELNACISQFIFDPNHQYRNSRTKEGNCLHKSKFSITINAGHLKRLRTLLPTTFVYEHMMPEHGTVVVSDEEGLGSWPLSFVLRQRERERGQGSFIGGWPAFSRDNSLKLGDVCQFELISEGQMKYCARAPAGAWLDTEFAPASSSQPDFMTMFFGPEFLCSKLYQLCSKEDMELAKALARPSSLYLHDLRKAEKFTEEGCGSVSRVYVICNEDRGMEEEFQRWMIQNYVVEDVMEIKESDHMAMLSVPGKLFDCLCKIAENYS
ncbi:unnamed protein product [Linum tenue]|uniref:TF-B3 domain-containing protein n=1 Tax=Linum tenue TaxID=586396 RepID=A0AAV0R9B2_9ROSI|nr:unnamed protein product [Linum tenue]